MVTIEEGYRAMGILPSYRKPPVNEVACGVRFSPSDRLHLPHIGLLWDTFRADYPRVEHAMPLAARTGQLLVDPSTGAPIPRVWFINDTDDELIQFQGDCFYYNWRYRGRDYPRYGHVIENFERVSETIETFYEQNMLGSIEPSEYELTYINHILRGEGWDSIDDLPSVFSDLNWTQTEKRFLPKPLGVSWQLAFPLPEDNGRLMVSLKHGTRSEDQMPVLVFELKATGMGDTSGKENIRVWFDLSREWIVKGFTDLTTPAMHQLWEREDE